MRRAKPASSAIGSIPAGGGDTLALWRWQGKVSRIKALTLLGGRSRPYLGTDGRSGRARHSLATDKGNPNRKAKFRTVALAVFQRFFCTRDGNAG